MPVTPFHMGPGLLIKSVMQGYFSIIIFAWAQVLMDIQPLVAILTGKGSLHGFSHTYVGATLIALVSACTGTWVYRWIARFIEKDFTDYQKRLFNAPGKLTTGICIISAFIGTFSHVMIDSIMHADMEPFFPMDLENRLLLIVSIGMIYKLCMYTGLAGAILYFATRLARIKQDNA